MSTIFIYLIRNMHEADILLSISENSFEEKKGTHTDKTSCCVVNHIVLSTK